MAKLFQTGKINFYQTFLQNHDIKLNKGFRTVFELVLAAHCSGSEGIMREYYIGTGERQWYELLHAENNNSLQNRDNILKFASMWEIPTEYFDSGLDCIFIEIYTFRDKTDITFVTMYSGEYARYREELSRTGGDS